MASQGDLQDGRENFESGASAGHLVFPWEQKEWEEVLEAQPRKSKPSAVPEIVISDADADVFLKGGNPDVISPPNKIPEREDTVHDSPTAAKGSGPQSTASPSWAISEQEAQERARMGREIAAWRPPKHLRVYSLELMTSAAMQRSGNIVGHVWRKVNYGGRSGYCLVPQSQNAPEPLDEGWIWEDLEEEIKDDWENIPDPGSHLPTSDISSSTQERHMQFLDELHAGVVRQVSNLANITRHFK